MSVSECVPNGFCADSDCDTLCDREEGSGRRDTDRDGTPDSLDADSDGDGISDLEEAGDEDPATAAFDRNRDGIPDYLDARYPLRAGNHRVSAVTAGAGAAAGEAGGSEARPAERERCATFVADGCEAVEASGCNGLDDDCDGAIDEAQSCSCRRGEVRACFDGAPGRLGVGACSEGRQVCIGESEPHWGPCEASRGPSSELCDGLDNDCDGCTDDLQGCSSVLQCPAPGDVRLAAAQPFVPYALDAREFYAGDDGKEVHWTIAPGPCDRLFTTIDPSARAENGKLSFTLAGATEMRAEALFTLSGTYVVALRIVTVHGVEHRCSFPVRVRAPGLRVELCWDKTGPVAHARGESVDLDLHLAKQGTTAAFFTAEDCYAETCRGGATPWDYADTTPLARCSGEFTQLAGCPNPRLDLHNRIDAISAAKYLAEMISLDAPAPGDRFRVMVHYRTSVPAATRDEDAGAALSLAAHPIVNIYCGGELRGSFGGTAEQLGDREEVGLFYAGEMWRVADIVSGDGTCAVQPLVRPEKGVGYWVSDFDASYGE